MNESSSNAPQESKKPGSSLWARKKKLILTIAAVVVVFAAGFGVALMLTRKDSPKASNTNNSNQGGQRTDTPLSDFAAAYKDVCKEREVSFENAPLAMDKLGYIIPMGQMSDGHVTPTDHVYLAPAVQSVPDNTYDVFMPAKGTVVAVGAMPAQYIGDKNQQTAPEDHRVVIAHNCQYYSIFIHIHQLSDALKQAVGTLQPNETKMVNVELNAGDKLGKIGGSPFDWSLLDVNKRLTGFITPSLYKGENWKIHVIDPLTVYTGAFRDQLIAKSLRSSEPYGGKIDYDVRGALVGNWFEEGTNGYEGASMDRYWDGHLAVVPDHLDPASTVVSIGNWEGKAAQMAVKGKVDPSKVTKATGPVKYELMSISYMANGKQYVPNYFAKGITQSQDGTFKGTIMFEVGDNEHLKVEKFPGKTAAQVSGFTSAAKTYVR
ncbi:MAG TPA: hypothetical protein VJM46_04600 [Candidatus Saccharimonadales bacterium]|nr:hypothetical protein [Candidatus Saccharimonadales bacterium]